MYQWVLFSIAELEGSGGDARRFKETDPARAEAGAERFAGAAKAVQDALAGRDYLVGDRFSIADLMVGAVLIPSKNAGLTEGLTALDAYIDRLDARPERQRSLRDRHLMSRFPRSRVSGCTIWTSWAAPVSYSRKRPARARPAPRSTSAASSILTNSISTAGSSRVRNFPGGR